MRRILAVDFASFTMSVCTIVCAVAVTRVYIVTGSFRISWFFAVFIHIWVLFMHSADWCCRCVLNNIQNFENFIF